MRPAPCDRLPKERYRRTPSTQYIDQDKERGPCPPFMMRRMHCMRPCHHVGGRGSLTKTRTEYSEASSVDAWTGARPQASSRTKPMSRIDLQACKHVSVYISECALHVCVYIRVCAYIQYRYTALYNGSQTNGARHSTAQWQPREEVEDSLRKHTHTHYCATDRPAGPGRCTVSPQASVTRHVRSRTPRSTDAGQARAPARVPPPLPCLLHALRHPSALHRVNGLRRTRSLHATSHNRL